MEKYYISYERDSVGQGIVIEASTEDIAKQYFLNEKPDAKIYGIREAHSEAMKPGLPIRTVPKEFEEQYYAKQNSETEYPVYIVSEGGTKREFTVCETEQKAKELCELYNWEYRDENDFVWGMDYDEREKEKPSLDAMLKEATACITNPSGELQIEKEPDR